MCFCSLIQVCAGRLQRSIVASAGLKHAGSVVMSARPHPSTYSALPHDGVTALKNRQKITQSILILNSSLFNYYKCNIDQTI